MLLALPAGALADIVDRRRLLIAVQVYLLIVAGALGDHDVAGTDDRLGTARIHLCARRRRRH